MQKNRASSKSKPLSKLINLGSTVNRYRHSHRGEIYAITSGLCYGSIGYFGMNVLNSGLSVTALSFWRFFPSALFMLLILFCRQNSEPRTTVRKYLFRMLTIDSLLYSSSSFLYFIACTYIGSGLCMVIFFIYPAMVSLLQYFFHGTRINKRYWLCFAVITIGMVLLIDRDEVKTDVLGTVLAIGSALLYAIYCLSSTKTMTVPLSATFSVCLGSAIFSASTALLRGESIALPLSADLLPLSFYLGGLVLFGTVIPILFLLRSFDMISVKKASILSASEPAFGIILGITLLGERVTMIQLGGVAMIILSAIIIMAEKKEQLA